MTRLRKATKFAIEEFVRQNPEWASKEYRVEAWNHLHPLQKEMVMDFLTVLANSKLEEVEPLN